MSIARMCTSREEQSIHRESDSKLPGSRVIVANIALHRFEINTIWDLLTQLSRELVELDQICQFEILYHLDHLVANSIISLNY